MKKFLIYFSFSIQKGKIKFSSVSLWFNTWLIKKAIQRLRKWRYYIAPTRCIFSVHLVYSMYSQCSFGIKGLPLTLKRWSQSRKMIKNVHTLCGRGVAGWSGTRLTFIRLLFQTYLFLDSFRSLTFKADVSDGPAVMFWWRSVRSADSSWRSALLPSVTI